MFGWLSAASVRASRSNRASRSGSAAKGLRQALMATSRSKPGVARAIDLAHAASAHDPVISYEAIFVPGDSVIAGEYTAASM